MNLLIAALALWSVVAAAPPLTVHIIAHTHDDVGWLKTVDEYYYGANQTIQSAGVQYILDSVIPALEQNPLRRFIYVEIAFFARWWREQSAAMQSRVRKLVANKQLEFVNGGWCMNDEAATHYEAVIEQMSLGHEFLLREFGVKPTIGWHIDPFGHSATQAALFAHMGFNAFFFARIDYQDYATRNVSKQLEMVWRPSQSLREGGQSDLFTHVLYDTTYCYAPGFAFEWANSPPIKDDKNLEGYNIDERAKVFANQMRERAKNYRTTEIMETFGCDFQYENANVNFKNMDKLMKYINDRPSEFGMTLKYSTPSTYVAAVHAKNLTWEVKTDDFFPYADRPHAYWTGYFTSRPALKGYVRQSNALLHATDRAQASIQRVPHMAASLRAALATAQHHDAVSGTEKQHVADDYAKRLAIGSSGKSFAYSLLGAALAELALRTASAPRLVFDFCPLLNVSICAPLTSVKHGDTLPLLLYNPLAQARRDYARVPLALAKNAVVLAPDGSPIAAQTLPNPDTGKSFLVFPVDVPPLGHAIYFIDLRNATKAKQHTVESSVERIEVGQSAQAVRIGNSFLELEFDSATNLLSAVTDLKSKQSIGLTQNFHYYNGSTGNNAESTQASGAYIFRPNRTETFGVESPNNHPQTIAVHRGPWVAEVYQVWNDWVSQSVRLYAGSPDIELVQNVGPIPIADGRGKEVITRFESRDIASNGEIFTDAQGEEMQHRKLNYRPTWHLKVNEPVSGNYYPKNSASFIQDAKSRLTLVTDRSSGVASLKEGEMENMLHRRLLVDDGRGVGEPLNETEGIRAFSKVVFDSPENSSRRQRAAALSLDHPLIYAFAKPLAAGSSVANFNAEYRTTFSSLQAALPANIHLLTFRKTSDSANEYLVRLHHVFAVGEDKQLSQPTTIDLAKVFVDQHGNNLTPVKLTELALSGNQPLADVTRLVFNSSPPAPAGPLPKPQPSTDFKIVMKPMQTRTFSVTFN